MRASCILSFFAFLLQNFDTTTTTTTVAQAATTGECKDSESRIKIEGVPEKFCPYFARKGTCHLYDEVADLCPVSCNACPPSCKDDGCASLAKDGLCSNPTVRMACPDECSGCALLAAEGLCSDPGIAKRCQHTCFICREDPRFTSNEELRDAAIAYCTNPGQWSNHEMYSRYGPVEDWDVSLVDSMVEIFSKEDDIFTNCNPDLSSWDTSSVTDFTSMFDNATAFNSDISSWDTSLGQDFDDMFLRATSFNADISGWDMSSGKRFISMFNGASNFNADISGWNVTSATTLRGMFAYASAFDQNLCDWNVNESTSTRYFCTQASCGNCSWY